VRAVAHNKTRTLFTSLKTKLSWGVLGSLLGITLGGYYYFKGNTALALSFILISPLIPLFFSFQLYNAYLNGKKSFKLYGVLNIISQIIITLSIALALFFTKQVYLLVTILFLTQTLLNIIFFIYTIKKLPPNDSESPEAISFGKHLSLISVIDIVAINIDEILVWHFLGTIPVAIYSFALLMPKQIDTLLVRILNALVIPKFAERTKELIKINLPKKILSFLVLTIFIVIIYLVLAPFVFSYLFPNYLESINFSRVAILSLLFSSLMLINFYFKAQAKIKELYYSTLTERIIRIVLLLILLPRYGIWGAILAPILSLALSTPYVLYLFKKS
jgi:O-antigen/teichoic acid export membrane protein